MDGKTIRQKQHGTVGHGGDGFEFKIRARKQHVRIARERAERAASDGERLPLPRSGVAPIMHDGRGLGREMKRRIRADADIKLEPVACVKPARRRLQIDRQEIGPRRVEIEAARHVQGIADPLAAKRGPAAGQVDRKMGFDVPLGIRRETGLRLKSHRRPPLLRFRCANSNRLSQCSRVRARSFECRLPES